MRRGSTISIYDYPEHLNPFREERRPSIGNKFRSFGQRGSSFRNAWNLLLPRSKRSQSFSSASPPPLPGQYDTWLASRAPRTQHEAIGLPSSWTISPRRRYTPPGSPSSRGSNTSLATLGTDVPSADDRFHWQGARPKKRRAPLPPTSPVGSNATSSHASSNTSLHDGRQPEDTRVAERESLQILVSRIQQEFGEGSSLSRHDQIYDREETKSEDSVEGITASGSYRVDRSNVQVEKPFVIEPPPPSGDTPEDNNSEENDKEVTIEKGHGDVTNTDSDPKQDCGKEHDGSSCEIIKVDDAIDEPKEVAIHAPQVTTNVFVETTSKTISSDGKITITTSDEVKSPNAAELGSGEQIREKSSVVTNISENEDDRAMLHQTTDSRNHSSQSETDSLVTSEAAKDFSSVTSASECQVETVPVLFDCGAFVISTPDTASVYEDAASEDDVEGPEVKTTINGFHKSSPKEENYLDSSKSVVDANIQSISYVVPIRTKSEVCHTKLPLKTFSNNAKPITTTSSNDHGTKTLVTVIPDNPPTTCTSDRQKLLSDASSKDAPIQTMSSGTLKYHTSVSVSLLKEDEGSRGPISGNTSPVISPLKDIGERANGDIRRTPQTAPRYKPANGRSEQTSSIAKAESPVGSSTSTPTPPPRNKPQPVPRIKRLKKLFSNH